MLDKKVLDVLACPVTKGKLEYHPELNELWSRQDKKAYRIEENIPVMLVEEARELTAEELEKYSEPKSED